MDEFDSDFDVEGDIGDQCYVTGNSPDGGAGTDDVDDGYTRLASPGFDLSGYTDPQVSYYRWFANAGGFSNPNDHLIISLTNGANTAVVEDLTAASFANNWTQTAIRVSDYLTPTANMRLIAETADASGSGHLVEAALDQFEVTELGNPIGITGPEAAAKTQLSISPNPFKGQTTVFVSALPGNQNAQSAVLRITNLQGKTLLTLPVPANTGTFTLQQGNLSAGLYFYTLEQNNQTLTWGKIVVAE